MAGSTAAERTGSGAPKEAPLDLDQRRDAVLEINGLVADRAGIAPDQRSGFFVGGDGFEYDGRLGPDQTRVSYPGISAEGNRYIIRTFYGGKKLKEPAFEVLFPFIYKNLGLSTQTALNEARKLLTPPTPNTPQP